MIAYNSEWSSGVRPYLFLLGEIWKHKPKRVDYWTGFSLLAEAFSLSPNFRSESSGGGSRSRCRGVNRGGRRGGKRGRGKERCKERWK